MPGLDNDGQYFFDRHLVFDDDHLAARDHDVAHAHLDNLKHPLNHLQSVGIENLACLSVTQQFQQFFTVPWFTPHGMDQSVHEGATTAAFS